MGQRAVVRGMGMGHATSAVCSPQGSVVHVPAHPLQWGAEGHPEAGMCIETFYESLVLLIIYCIAGVDCRYFVPWLLANYVIKLLLGWPSLNYRNWAELIDASVIHVQVTRHCFINLDLHTCVRSCSQVPPGVLRWTARTFLNYCFFWSWCETNSELEEGKKRMSFSIA